MEVLVQVISRDVVALTVNKCMTSDAMRASSAIESIFAIQGMRTEMIPPTINHTPDSSMVPMPVVQTATAMEQEFVLKNAFGFGGCNACVVFKRVRI